MSAVSFLTCTWDDGVFALKLDLSFLRPKRAKKKLGPRPAPPPFALPPVKKQAPPLPSVIIDDSINALLGSPEKTLLMDDGEESTAPLDAPKTDLVKQRREVRKALRGTSR